MTIDWSTAPKWAQYHAFDSREGEHPGVGRYHEHKPQAVREVGFWMRLGIRLRDWLHLRQPDIAGFWFNTGKSFPSGLTRPADLEWWKSATERPKGE